MGTPSEGVLLQPCNECFGYDVGHAVNLEALTDDSFPHIHIVDGTVVANIVSDDFLNPVSREQDC